MATTDEQNASVSSVLTLLVSEKGNHLSEKFSRYTFRAPLGMDKPQIRAEVERAYAVKVESVHTLICKGKPKRSGYRWRQTPPWKKAVVQLREGYSIGT